MEERRTTPYTVAEIHELAQKRADEWATSRLVEVFQMYQFEHACDQNYSPGPPSTKIEYHAMDISQSPYPRSEE